MSEDKELSETLAGYFLQITDTFFCTFKDDGTIQFVNEAASRLLNSPADELVGRNVLDLFSEDSRESVKEKIVTITGRSDYFPVQIVLPDKSVVDIKVRLIPLFLGDDKVFMMEANDQSQNLSLERKIKSLESRIFQLSPIDLETHLPSPVLFADRTDQAILRALREARGNLEQIQSFLSVMVLNILNFEQIEQKFGMEGRRYVTDILVSRFKSTIRSVDTLAKPKEDFFYFLFESIRDKANIQIIIDRLKNCAKVPIAYKGENIVLDINLGVAIYPDNGTSAVTLMKWARLNTKEEAVPELEDKPED